MYCDNCGSQTPDDAVFCSKCGQQLMLEKKLSDVPPPRRVAGRQKTQDNFLRFGEEEENTYSRGIFFLFIALFFFIIFFVPGFPVEALVVLAFFLIGVITIVRATRE